MITDASDNAEKLEQMRLTVDEKMHNTLEQRLGASFKVVSEQLEQVFRGVGEMQSTARGSFQLCNFRTISCPSVLELPAPSPARSGRIATSLNDEVIRAGVRHEVGTLAADHNPLDERMRAMAASTAIPTPESTLEIRKHSEAGLLADPDNARLLALLAYWLASDVLNGWNGAGKAEVDGAESAARKAISLDPSLARAHTALGWVHRIRGNHKAALDAFKEAIKIDPNFAPAYAQAANEMVLMGDAKAAIPLAEKALELSPNDMSKDVFTWVAGRAYFAVGDYAKAAENLEKSVQARPNLWFSQAWLVAALALSNQNAEAKRAYTAYKKAHVTRSDFAFVSKHYSETRFQSPAAQAATAQLLDGLRKAGVK
jgi:adenylate cyclase